MSAIIEWIKSKIGCGYVYGATGWTCTQKRLEQQAQQYPEYADTILNTCKKWIGVQCFDCAQLIRRALETVGVSAPSGATSQWKSNIWSEKGEIANMPDKLCALYRQSGSKMQHTGWHIGGGVTIDARGSEYGVILSDVSKYPWTHYAVPNLGGEGEKEEENMSEETLFTANVVTESGNLNFRTQPTTSAARVSGCSTIPRGASVEVVELVNDEWARVRYDGHVGFVSRKFLDAVAPAPEQPENEGGESATGCESTVKAVRILHRITTKDGQTFDIDGDFTVTVVVVDDETGAEL